MLDVKTLAIARKGGVSSWNDLKDKPFDATTEEKTFSVEAMGVVEVEGFVFPAVGETVTLKVNGTEVTETVKSEEVPGFSLMYLGAYPEDIWNGVETGWSIYYYGGRVDFCASDETEITVFVRVVSPIDYWFLPAAQDDAPGVLSKNAIRALINSVGHGIYVGFTHKQVVTILTSGRFVTFQLNGSDASQRGMFFLIGYSTSGYLNDDNQKLRAYVCNCVSLTSGQACEVRFEFLVNADDSISDDAELQNISVTYSQSMFLQSDSGKTFEVTVDGSGTLTATEVTG